MTTRQPSIAITRVEPIGTRKARGFGHRFDGTPVYEWDEPEYPANPRGRQLRDLRVSLGFGLRECCAITGASAVEWSGLENGWATADFDEAERLLREAAEETDHG